MMSVAAVTISAFIATYSASSPAGKSKHEGFLFLPASIREVSNIKRPSGGKPSRGTVIY